MSKQELTDLITKAFQSKPIMQTIGFEEDFFDLGASSLTVIDLQLDIEEKLGVAVPTKTLMGEPTIKGWVDAYSEKVST